MMGCEGDGCGVDCQARVPRPVGEGRVERSVRGGGVDMMVWRGATEVIVPEMRQKIVEDLMWLRIAASSSTFPF